MSLCSSRVFLRHCAEPCFTAFPDLRVGGWQLAAADDRATVAQEEASARELELQKKLAAATADVEAGADADDAHVSAAAFNAALCWERLSLLIAVARKEKEREPASFCIETGNAVEIGLWCSRGTFFLT